MGDTNNYEKIRTNRSYCRYWCKSYGKTLSEAFENVAKAMFDIITDNSEIESVGQYNIELESTDLEQLAVDFLSELLYLNSARNVVFGFFKVNIDEKKNFLSAVVFGEKFNLSKHKINRSAPRRHQITYHCQ